jgi:hypothetical protein
MANSSRASLRTTPYKKNYCQKYDIDYLRRKGNNRWPEIWDGLGIPSFYQQNKCPLCKFDGTFQIIDISTGVFYCSHCKLRGDGILLLQHYHKWDIDEVLELIGRNLRLRDKDTIYG